ncbi:uncharacterized protein [Arachis hypogaea]|uniref:uncharacterized protein n=1 Tax=Arachis hypogaea TaxID=3818 RepID=UPI000DED2CDA
MIKVLDRKYSYTALSHKLRVVWHIKGGFNMLYVKFGYFLLKFDAAEDREKFYVSLDSGLRSPNLVLSGAGNAAYCNCNRSLGKSQFSHQTSREREYAHICVQINLRLSVIKNIIVEGVIYDVEYETLTLLCEFCAKYGHDKSQCLAKDPLEEKRESGQGEPQEGTKSDP